MPFNPTLVSTQLRQVLKKADGWPDGEGGNTTSYSQVGAGTATELGNISSKKILFVTIL